MKLIFKLSIIILILSVFYGNTHYIHAQIPNGIDRLTINKSTDNPRPGQNVDITLESYLIDLNSSSIVWLVNGKTQEKGIGIKKISVTAPKVGSVMTITAVVSSSDGLEARKSVTIKTGSVEIILESEGYSHPFYKSKIPYTYQNKVRLIAMPHISKDGKNELDPKTLVYSWKSDGKYIENGQGYGKQYVEIRGSEIPKPLNVSVEVYNREQTDSTFGSINIEPTDPSLSFYENDALYGILYNKSLNGRVPLNNSEMKIIAIPFGFNSIKNSYAWSINNIQQNDLIENRSITVRVKGDVDGSSNINLDVRNTDNILQGARSGFTVYFSKKQNQNVDNEITF